MFVVGITGGIGSGKTAATDRFSALGITIVDADIASRIVVEPGTPALQKIAEHFGADILQSDGSLKRAALRKIIFADTNAKLWLEKLLHPLIAAEIQNQLKTAKSSYVVFVSPLLTESNQHELCDRILVIDAPENLQLQRTMERDNNDAAQVQRIIASQASREHRLKHADDVIENTGSLDHLTQQVATLHARYLQLAAEKSRTKPLQND
ncbi:MAG: dephospho-CoA kinase [Spongiibacteraceae bacterium]